MFKWYIRLLIPKCMNGEFDNLLAIQDNYPKMVVAMDEQENVSYQSIEQIPIRKFLLYWK